MLESILQRDRIVVLAAVIALSVTAWAYLFYLSADMTMAPPAMDGMDMPGMDMPGMDMPGMEMPEAPGAAPETAETPFARDLVVAFVMWTVMMIGMMTPSVAPMILLYARVGRQAAATGKVFAPAAIFAAGYLLAWIFIALIAAALQIFLSRNALLTPMLESTSDVLNGVLLLAAGAYQWSPVKNLCLTQCRSPLLFVQRNGGFRGSISGALTLGLKHGLYCVGCCWALMALLFVGGVMNLAWVAGLAVIVLLEKILPGGRLFPRVLGLVLMIAGLIVLLSAWT